MPIITLPSGKTIEVSRDVDLRTGLEGHKTELYHPFMLPIHCRGLGTCGTCAVYVEGETSDPTAMEKWRLNFPPHKNGLEKGLRLACQCKPISDLKLVKQKGKWGQGQ